jgi:hypothetical protein
MHRSRTRTPSTSSTSPDSEDSRVGPNMIESPIATGAPVRAPKEPALSRGWVPAARYSFPPDDTEMSPLVYERMPLPGLCSRLVVTSTRWTALLPSLGLSPFRPPRPVPPFRPSLRPGFQNATVHGDADRPLPAFSALSGDAVDAAPPAAAALTAPKGHPVSRVSARRGIVRPKNGPDGPASKHPLSPPRPSLGIPSSVPKGQDRHHEPPVKAAPARPIRGAFRRQVPAASPDACAPHATFRAATSASALPPWPSVRHAFTPSFAER